MPERDIVLDALAVCNALAELDWCIGYELTEKQSVRLDTIRDAAQAVMADMNERLKSLHENR